MRQYSLFLAVAMMVVALGASIVSAEDGPWTDRSLPPARRAALLADAMTRDEKLGLVRGVLGAPWGGAPRPDGALGSAGFVPGVPRLGIPALQETDGALGVSHPGDARRGDNATAMPSNLALASSFSPSLAREQGAAVGAQARALGFNLLLGGTASLVRDPRGGRAYEYFSEDPLLAGAMAGAAIAGVQSRHVLSTAKHFVLNAQETDRLVLDARIDDAALRESDLLAFEIAIERGRPGAVMCAYNQVNGTYACENAPLLSGVLKGDWSFPGFVLSDWGAVHSTVASALANLDQESGSQLDAEEFFGSALRDALDRGAVPAARLDDMVRRILGSMVAAGLYDDPVRPGPLDTAAGEEVAARIAEVGAVLLRNEGAALPLSPRLGRVAVIGGDADRGVLAGGGSSEVVPTGGFSAREPSPPGLPGEQKFDPSSPLDAIRRQAPGAEVVFADGRDVATAARLAASADAAILFATQWSTEAVDRPDLQLPGGQDALIQAVGRANPRTVVVLETGGPVLTPWLARVPALLEAWYPGQRGGEAIARLLFGAANPSGHLPVTWPESEAQLPSPKLPGDPSAAPPGPLGPGGRYGPIVRAAYPEGADTGYKWFARRGLRPAFPFGFGLSYTDFTLQDLVVSQDGAALRAEVTLRNTGGRAGVAVPQVYVERPDRSAMPLRLAGFSREELAPGGERRVGMSLDPRLLARFDEAGRRWVIEPGPLRVTAGFDAAHRALSAEVTLGGATLPP